MFFCSALETSQPFVEMQLDIPSQGSTNMDECIRKFFQKEILTGWDCTQCNQKRDAVMSQRFVRAPEVLVVLLRRFEYDFVTKQTRKINTLVESKLLVTIPTTASHYELDGVVNHKGTAYGGHYTANCRLRGRRWMRFSDEHCDLIKLAEIVTSEAYILFFSKTDSA